ncbi:MAG: ABC-F family ATP-binding cassette domain-containing protein, partial [Bacteroidales bacterium]|nr:ABC-F family ATP-binding cassette domain-containing protein [Bacteroidales bacterium]
MNFLQAERISKSFGDLLLFESLSLSVDEGQKIALIAKNGTGKSTLLRILALDESCDSGAVNSKRDLSIGYLPQEPELNDDLQIIDQVLFSNPDISQTIQAYEEAVLAEDPGDLDKAMLAMDRLNAWDFESRIKEVLTRLKITDFHQAVNELSGGQRKRVALAQVLLIQPDLLILDEPTNHLDLDMIEWLEEYLSQSHITLLMVTHDRYFLNRVCTDILEMSNRTLFRYQGNYRVYLDKRQQRIELENKRADKANSLMKKELEWVNRMPKARGTKAKYRIESFERLKEAARKEYAPEQDEIKIESLRLGKKVLEVEGLSKQYDDLVLFKNFEYKFQRRERIGLVGANGVGKSTFLSVITGQIPPDAGRAVPGSTVRFGFYEQTGIKFDP